MAYCLHHDKRINCPHCVDEMLTRTLPPKTHSALIGLIPLLMNTAPQSVTERYVSNLINYGRNREFDIYVIQRRQTIDDNICVGVYFAVTIVTCGGDKEQSASGATISQAVRRALEKHGVTFR